MQEEGRGSPVKTSRRNPVLWAERPLHSRGVYNSKCRKANACETQCHTAWRSEYWGRLVQKCPGLHADGTPYAAIIRRRCLDCGQVRIDKEYQ